MESIDPKVEEEWRQLLQEGHRPFRLLRTVFRHLPTEPRCKLCQNPFGGAGGKLVGWLGFRPSPMNPNLCSRCCDGLPRGGAELEIAILFADVRGSMELGTQLSTADYTALLNRYYVAATRALIKHDAIIDKLIGDEVMALFIPGICGPAFRRRAAEAALELLEAVGYGGKQPWLKVGVGVHAGMAYVGNVGAEGIVDFTALGEAVNMASRLQEVAAAGEAVVSEGIYAELNDSFPAAAQKTIMLRGAESPLVVRSLALR